MDSRIHLHELIAQVKLRNPQLVCLQIPEGLKFNVTEIEDAFTKENIPVITILDPSFGACDIADDKAKLLGADLLVHFGHAKMMHTAQNVIYWPVFYDFDEAFVQDAVAALKKDKFFSAHKKIGLFVTIQFHSNLEKIRKGLEQAGFEVHTGKGDLLEGQILGCDASARHSISEKCGAFLYFGDGYFHSLAVAYATDKPTYQFNPFNKELEHLNSYREKLLRVRSGIINKAMDAQTFGIIVCTKKGQMRKALALKTKAMLEEAGKKAYLFCMDHITPQSLIGVQCDAYVNTACTRIAIDDAQNYSKPMLTPAEIEILVGKRPFAEYKLDEIRHFGTKVE